MKKIVVFQGSPRKNGACAKILDQIMAGAKSKGAEVIFCDLNGDGVKGCQGCGWCRSHDGCITKDAMAPALEALREADGMVASFPIYWGGVSGQAKLLIDRLYSFASKNFTSKHPGKKFITVYAQGAGDPEVYRHVVEANDRNFTFFQWELIDHLLAYGTSANGCELSEALQKQAFEAGCRIAE